MEAGDQEGAKTPSAAVGLGEDFATQNLVENELLHQIVGQFLRQTHAERGVRVERRQVVLQEFREATQANGTVQASRLRNETPPSGGSS